MVDTNIYLTMYFLQESPRITTKSLGYLTVAFFGAATYTCWKNKLTMPLFATAMIVVGLVYFYILFSERIHTKKIIDDCMLAFLIAWVGPRIYRQCIKKSPRALVEKFRFKKDAIECVVCMDPGESGYFCRRCKHGFHAECLKQWLAESAVCPHCRHAV